MKTVELFAGIGGFRIAADMTGLTTVWANDIDEKAIRVYKDNFGEKSIVQGDINDLLDTIPDHDLLTGGFPCQPFSKAGKKLGTDDYRGTLFESIVKIITKKQPKYFVLENVNSLLFMNDGLYYNTILSALLSLDYKVEWIVLNASDFGLPQNRTRVIIVGSKNLKHNQSFFLNNDNIKCADENKISVFENWDCLQKHSKKFRNWGMAFHDRFVSFDLPRTQYCPQKTLRDIICKKVDKCFDYTEDTVERIKNSVFVNKYFNDVQILYNQKGGARMGYSVFGIDGVAPTLTASSSRHYERYKIGNTYRRLTNTEYARIQGFPDNHCKAVSINMQYKLFGNAVPPQIIAFVLKKIVTNDYYTVECNQLSLFNEVNNMDIQEYKDLIKNHTPEILSHINEVLNGNNLEEIEPILTRIDSTGSLPNWFLKLKGENELPNLDGKTVGSVIEKLLVCILEKYIFEERIELSINPAKGVDIPELELGIKSPSTNYCTSEPYFSAYERLLGNEYDAIVLLTNYQEAKGRRPFQLQILEIQYLEGCEIADKNLCEYAKFIRDNYTDELILKKAFRFLAYINQSDWEASWILKIIKKTIVGDYPLDKVIPEAKRDFDNKNRKYDRENKPLIPEDSLNRIIGIKDMTPELQSIINAADNWVILSQKDNGRYPNENEWHRLMNSKLNGKIGMSFALQWRYNFGLLFR